jgi:hypothetical protein
MNTDPLENILASYAKSEVPPATTGAPEIWREIERRKKKGSWLSSLSLLDWRELFLEPKLAAAGLALAVIAGSMPLFLTSSHQVSEAELARESLHLDVFSNRAGNVFSTYRTVGSP